MQPTIQTWIYQQTAIAGVECVQTGGHFYYNLCLLKKEKDSAKIVLQKQQIPSIEQLKEHLEEDTPIFLAANIKGMLHRQLDYQPKDDAETLNAVFPSAQATDFYVQTVPSHDNYFATVVRKDSIDRLIQQLLEADLWVVNVFLGSFWIAEILPLLSSVTAIQSSQLLLTIEEQSLTGFSKSTNEGKAVFMIGDEQVHEPVLLALSMAFLGITQATIQGISTENIQQQQQNFYYKKLLHYSGLLALAVFFIALLINYLLFDYYNQQRQELQIEVSQQQSLLEKRDSLAKKYAEKSALLGDQLYLGASKTSYYADQLAATLPSTLRLTSLVLFPEIKANQFSSGEELPRYDNQKIIIKGTCQASVFYNNWKQAVEELRWVKSIHNMSYQNAPNGQGIFELAIQVQHE